MKNKKFLIRFGIKIAFIILVIVLAVLAVSFAARQIKKINSTMLEKKKIDWLVKNQNEINAKIENDFLSVDPDYEKKINASLPSIYNILTFVADMDGLASKNSLISNLNFSQPVAVPGAEGMTKIVRINFTLNLGGAKIDSLISYLKDFEKMPYFATIDSVDLTGPGGTGWLENSTVTLSGKLYAKE